jgi:hypothetical protein
LRTTFNCAEVLISIHLAFAIASEAEAPVLGASYFFFKWVSTMNHRIHKTLRRLLSGRRRVLWLVFNCARILSSNTEYNEGDRPNESPE